MSDIRKKPVENAGSSEETLGHLTWRPALKEEMQEQLANLLFQKEIDIEALNLLLDRMEKAGQFPDSPSTEESLKRFHRQYAAVFEAANTQSVPAPVSAKKRFWRTAAKTTAAAVVASLLLCTAAQAMGMDVFSTFAHWTSEILCLGGQSASYASVQHRPLAEGECASFDSLEGAVAAFGIEAPIAPKEVPERFELVSVVAYNQKSGILIRAKYVSKDGNFQSYFKEIDRQNYHSVEIEREYSNTNPYVINSIKHYLTADKDRQKADWENGDFECHLAGSVSEEEMKEIIHSIY